MTTARNVRIALLNPALDFAAYDEIVTAIRDSLQSAGALVDDLPSARAAERGVYDALLIVGNIAYYPDLLGDLRARRRDGAWIPTLLWQLEHLPDPRMPPWILAAHLAKNGLKARNGRYPDTRAGNYLTIRRAARERLIDHCLVFTAGSTRFLSRHGIAAQQLALGHHPLWGDPETAAASEIERDIDVLFLGEIGDDRRGRIVRRVQAGLAAAGIRLRTIHDFDTHGLWGEPRNALLRRTRILLNVYRHPTAWSGLRMGLGMANGALVISEPIDSPEPFVPGVHFAAASPGEMPATILKYLRDESARVSIASASLDLVRTEYAMMDSAKRIIEIVGTEGRAPQSYE